MNVVVLLATGFEELEAVTIVDVLRRAGISVLLAGIAPPPIEGGHGIKVEPDLSIDDVTTYDALVLPGGSPGYVNLERDQRVLKLIRAAYDAGKYVGAICAAPHVLGVAGIHGRGEGDVLSRDRHPGRAARRRARRAARYNHHKPGSGNRY